MSLNYRYLLFQGQIFLDSFNPILENAIGPRLMEGKREPCELKVSDFDDSMYTLEVKENDNCFSLFRISSSSSLFYC